MNTSFKHTLVNQAAEPYRAASRFALHFARGKLGGDPAFVGLLEHGLIPDATRLLDLGCGQGLLASWLRTARSLYEAGNWPAHWPAAPSIEKIWGLELMPRDVARAQTALKNNAEFVQGDLRTSELGQADVIIILDVLHYINYDEQVATLQRIYDALPTGGTFITRIGDAAGGLPFKFSNWTDKLIFMARGHTSISLYCRTADEWIALLQSIGFDTRTLPMHHGTPFASVMLVSQKK